MCGARIVSEVVGCGHRGFREKIGTFNLSSGRSPPAGGGSGPNGRWLGVEGFFLLAVFLR